ncbi:MAG: hypothetical protein E7048_03005 [Lentisphaerae bacterium]|nr:hypothetical protein [Lentisphaerota bacterium]
MKTEYADTKAASRLFSWNWISSEFTKGWETLSTSSAHTDEKPIWESGFTDVRLLEVPSETGTPFRIAFKTYREKRFFRYFLRPSLAAREAKGFAVAASLDIPVVKVLAFGEKRKFLNLESAFFITAFEENTQTMLFFRENYEDREKLLFLLKENIVRLAKLHAAGYVHCGAHPRNFLWKDNTEGKPESIWLDLASLRKMPGGKKKWKYLLTDLSDFCELFKLTQAELDMLLAEYLKIFPIPVAYKLRTDHQWKFSEAYRTDK